MADDEYQLSDLVNALEDEKSAEGLCPLMDTFYRGMREYLDELEEEANDIGLPSNTEEEMIKREYTKAKRRAEALLNWRIKKIALAAVHEVSGAGKVSENKMTDREHELFQDTVKILREMKDEIFTGGYKRSVEEAEEKEVTSEKEDVSTNEERDEERDEEVDEDVEVDRDVEEEKSEKGTEPSEQQYIEEERPVHAEEERGEQKEAKEDKGKEKEVKEKKIDIDDPSEELLVHVIEDVPPFVDLDTSYDLKKEDVVTLSEEIAEVLIDREKVRKIELS